MPGNEQQAPEAPAQRVAQLIAENSALKLTLRQSRKNQRRAASISASKIVAQADEIRRLECLLSDASDRLAKVESGQTIIELGRQLMQLRETNDQLAGAAQRVWYLDKTLCAAHAECERLSRERDALAGRVAQSAPRRVEHLAEYPGSHRTYQ